MTRIAGPTPAQFDLEEEPAVQVERALRDGWVTVATRLDSDGTVYPVGQMRRQAGWGEEFILLGADGFDDRRWVWGVDHWIAVSK